jgi:soluble lytic murein transglycosylase-like protein
MSTINVTIPVVSPVRLASPTSWYKTRAGLRTQMDKVWAKYGKWFKYYGDTSKVSPAILFAFTMAESGGNPLGGGSSSPTQGLMQWNRNYVGGDVLNNVLAVEYQKGRLSPAEKEKFASFGIVFNSKGQTRKLTQADLQNPELNILVGSIILGQYLDTKWGTENGQARMDRVIARYNWGQAGFNRTKIGEKSLDQVLQSVPDVTRVYINKMLGQNGALDIAVNDMKIS